MEKIRRRTALERDLSEISAKMSDQSITKDGISTFGISKIIAKET
jgi:hypothetical protein